MNATAAKKDAQVLLFSEQPRLPADNMRRVTCRNGDCGIVVMTEPTRGYGGEPQGAHDGCLQRL